MKKTLIAVLTLLLTATLFIFLTNTTAQVEEVVSIPDANLAAAIRDALGKLPSGAPITSHAMLNLTSLSAPGSGITDLTGLEYARNLTGLNLGSDWVDGEYSINPISDLRALAALTQLTWLYLNWTAVSDVAPLAKLTQLTELYLPGTAVSDVAPLAKLTQLTELYLGSTAVADVAPLAHLTQLTYLDLGSTAVSDVAPLAKLTQLTWLSLASTAVSDVAPLAKLTQLTTLYLSSTAVSDVAPLAKLTQLTYLDLRNCPLNAAAHQTHLPAIQANGTEVEFDPFKPIHLPRVPGLVSLIYFRPSDRPVRPNVDAEIDGLIKEAQRFFADQLELHGFKRKTFQFETDAHGNAVVHHVNGKFTDEYYRRDNGGWGEEISEQVHDPDGNITVYMIDTDGPLPGACGVGGGSPYSGGGASIYCWDWTTLAHELGHAFGMGYHDFRDDAYIMSYGYQFRQELSPCFAAWLDVHPAFNPGQIFRDSRSQIQMLPATLVAPPNTIRLRFAVTAPAGSLLQARLLTPERRRHRDGSKFDTGGLVGCQRLQGNPTRSTVEFVTTALTPYTENVYLHVIGTDGSGHGQRFPIDVSSLLPPAKPVSLPDSNLAAAVRETLGLSSGEAITTQAMLRLDALEAPNRGIRALTGLEHAVNLRELNLGGEYVSGQGSVNSNAISDFSPLAKLAKLQTLSLRFTPGLADVAPLANLTQLTYLSLGSTAVADVAPLANLTQLTYLDLGWTAVADVAPLAKLTQLTHLNLGSTAVSDVAPLAKLTQLTTLWLGSTAVSDVAPLAKLTQLTELYLGNTAVADVAPLAKLTLLKRLQLQNTAVSDVAPLAKLTLLTYLNLQNTAVSDVAPLAKLTQLTYLDLRNCPLNAAAHQTHLPAIQANGTEVDFDPFDVSALLPAAKPVSLPDSNLAAAVREALSLSSGEAITTHAMLRLDVLEAPNAEIKNLTGLEHAVNLTELDLRGEYVSGEGWVNSNAVSDWSPLAKLAKLTTLAIPYTPGLVDVAPLAKLTLLTHLNLRGTAVSDVAPLAKLTLLTWLSLGSTAVSDVAPLAKLTLLTTLRLDGTAVSDVTPLANLTQLTQLYLFDMAVSDVAPLAKLTLLTELYLGSTAVADVAPLAKLTLLKRLQLQNTAVSDVAPLAKLTLLTYLNLQNTAVSDVAPLAKLTLLRELDLRNCPLNAAAHQTHLPAIQANGTEVDFDPFDVSALLPAAKPVSLPDSNLAAAVRETLSLSSGEAITTHAMLRLDVLDARNAEIKDLTGLEHAVTLKVLDLGSEYVSGEGWVNSNGITDLSVLSHLTQLTSLRLGRETLSSADEISAFVSSLPPLKPVSLPDSNLAAAVRETLSLSSGEAITTHAMLRLDVLEAPNAEIKNLTGLEHAVNLTELHLGGNGITDLSVLSHLTQLTSLRLGRETLSSADEISAFVSSLPPLKPVSLPDSNLAAAVREALGLSSGEALTTHAMLRLDALEARNAEIKNLTGLEHAVNLTALNLGGEYISGEGDVNSNAISDFSPLAKLAKLKTLELYSTPGLVDVAPLAKLTQLTTLRLNHTGVSDVAPLANLTQLKTLDLGRTAVDVASLAKLTQLKTLELWETGVLDVTPLAKLTQLKTLNLSDSGVSDVAPLANLTQLTRLGLGLTAVSDVAPLAKLTLLKTLGLDHTAVSDVAPLAKLTQLTYLNLSYTAVSDVAPLLGMSPGEDSWQGLYLPGCPLSYASLHTHIPAIQAKGIEVEFDNVAHPALLKISGDEQEGAGDTALKNPFVVEAMDEHGKPMVGKTVQFEILEGGGRLSATTVKTDARGKARITLTLGRAAGVNKVKATAEGIESWALFTTVATEAAPQLAADVNGDGVTDLADLAIVAQAMGKPVQNPRADVNGDGVVDGEDFAFVAAALGEGEAAAPSQAVLPAGLTLEKVEWALNLLHAENTGSPAFQRGIAKLEGFLALLVPEKTLLLANYPNPFNPETWIPYQLATPAEVTVTIYAANGAVVRTLALGHQRAGDYASRSRAAYWDGRNEVGERVASGVYFYTLQAGDFAATRKMLILK